MKLFFNPKRRATISRWVLDEAGAEYDIVPVDFEKAEQKTEAFLAVSPAGKLPALLDGSVRVFESVAIGLYVAEKFPAAKLAPAVGSRERGRYLSLMVYATSQVEPSLGDMLTKQEPTSVRGWTSFERVCEVVERELGQGPYLFGDWFTVTDILIGSQFAWMRVYGHRAGSKIDAYVDRLLARPHAPNLGDA